MIRTLTIVENKEEGKEAEYSANGALPIDEAARILVVIAYNAVVHRSVEPTVPAEPKKLEEEKKEPEKAP